MQLLFISCIYLYDGCQHLQYAWHDMNNNISPYSFIEVEMHVDR